MGSVNITIRGIPISFPFEPYPLQRDYMEKVIECLQNGTDGVLESPTGTGKTFSLLCSSLAWLTYKKAQVQMNKRVYKPEHTEEDRFLEALQADIDKKIGNNMQNRSSSFCEVPQIIYASRTHSQLTQAMQELKRTAYSCMRATILGSRDQLCIHPEVSKEANISAKTHMCRLKVKSRTCQFFNRNDKMKCDKEIREMGITDVEDLVTVGKKRGFCPFYMAKERKLSADIIFMPYNYILDPFVRKSIDVNLQNSIVIIDEAHNVEKTCEESASVQIKSADVALCIEEITAVMKAMTEATFEIDDDVFIDFTPDTLCELKQVFLDFEKALDSVELKLPLSDGTTFDGDYIYEIFKKANILFENNAQIRSVINKIVQFLSTAPANGPFQTKGNYLDLFAGILNLVFTDSSPEFKAKIKKAYRVHILIEEPQKKGHNDWLSRAASTSKKANRVLNFWCFSPGFAMNMLRYSGLKCVILTSGTLAPLKPLISELELNSQVVRIENPHIVTEKQVLVRILGKGPDGVELNSNFQNRNNPSYISSLGRTILNLTRITPHGMLIFFPSYPIMQKCRQDWEEEGIWGTICDQKAIYVEPKGKEAFDTVMTEYYSRIKNPQYKGAIFMGVCRGKIAEGLDFADINGRAVLITGLPYPPLKDHRVVLKRKYLDLCRSENKEIISGDEWYSLEASRAVNQAMGRVIRHQFDYGAIILLDSRFTGYKIKSQMSLWLRDQIKLVNNFGEIIRDLRNFFQTASSRFPVNSSPAPTASCTSSSKPSTCDQSVLPKSNSSVHRNGNFDFSTSSCCSAVKFESDGLVTIHPPTSGAKRKRITLVSDNQNQPSSVNDTQIKEYIAMVKNALQPNDFQAFVLALRFYRDGENFDELILKLDNIFLNKCNLLYIVRGLTPFVKNKHQEQFDQYWEKLQSLM